MRLTLAVTSIGLIVGVAAPSDAQQVPNWQTIALQAQRNAAAQQMVSNATIEALQAEIAQIKTEAAKPPAESGK